MRSSYCHSHFMCCASNLQFTSNPFLQENIGLPGLRGIIENFLLPEYYSSFIFLDHFNTITKGEGESDHHKNHGYYGKDESSKTWDFLIIHFGNCNCRARILLINIVIVLLHGFCLSHCQTLWIISYYLGIIRMNNHFNQVDWDGSVDSTLDVITLEL